MATLIQAQKRLISLGDYFNGTDIREAQISPNGDAVVISTRAPDWNGGRYRQDLWLWTEASAAVVPLVQFGFESTPRWSPDGKYIGFLSKRSLPSEGLRDVGRIWLVQPSDGEAFPLFQHNFEVHAFAWHPDSRRIYFSISQPLSKETEASWNAQWKDVIRWREQERGDFLIVTCIDDVIESKCAGLSANVVTCEVRNASILPNDFQLVARSAYRIEEIAPSPSGRQVVFRTGSTSQRLERLDAYEIYLVEEPGKEPKRLTFNQALESDLHWGPDGKSLFFRVRAAGGSVEGPYQNVQGRLYSLDPESTAAKRLGTNFCGSWEDYCVTSAGGLIAAGVQGVDQQLYFVNDERAERISNEQGTYAGLAAAPHVPRVLFSYSAIDVPTEIYIAEWTTKLRIGPAITKFNSIYTQHWLPQWRIFQWTGEDGVGAEGILIYPPGKLGAKNLRTLTLLHGGPAYLDSNRFGASWYDWAALAASGDWLVFRPNYRGSIGYGDDFMLQISPYTVSRPASDVLSGIRQLVLDGISDPERLAIGGYSFGGFLTNWLVTQTTQFKAAVTGAGAIEHAANWGTDDFSFADASYFGGTPWEKPELYRNEAALFRLDRVETPIHAVVGSADIRVNWLESILLERALEALNIPHSLLVFPEEDHMLQQNPWHGYIKVREELAWLAKHCP